MQQKLSLNLLPVEASDASAIKRSIAAFTGNPVQSVSGFHILKHSIDARARTIWVNLSLNAFINEPFQQRQRRSFDFKDVHLSRRRTVIIGAGPAGLFAALQLIEKGITPIILERGKEVRARRRDLAILNKEGIVNPDSNYCFGEGGAGTYSDGKLYTRSNKRGNIDRILNLFVHFGAAENILFEAHPHIGTNKLPDIITAIRKQITECGGIFHFEKKVTDIIIEKEEIIAVQTLDGELFTADAFILATGHSARDIFELLHQKQIMIEAKPFALGVRIEHPQSLIDQIQYHCLIRDENLPPASYSLVQQLNKRGVFSFCMCPGGIIAPASSATGELVINGWSPSKRNNPFANSGMVVQVELSDAMAELKKNPSANRPSETTSAGSLILTERNPLLMMYFQQMVEQKCFDAGGGKFVAPAQRMADFTNGKTSTTLPECSYLPGIQSTPLEEVLPPFIHQSLAEGFLEFGKRMTGRTGPSSFFTNEAIVLATESRTSSPVRIPRNKETLAHPQFKNLYPCGEGAGYAGGIVSAAMDGEKVALKIAEVMSS